MNKSTKVEIIQSQKRAYLLYYSIFYPVCRDLFHKEVNFEVAGEELHFSLNV